MNVFILDKSMEKSAQMLDDAHLISQINEGCQILMANFNKKHSPYSSIGHINHPVTKWYSEKEKADELFSYLRFLLYEYKCRFNKYHQNYFWYLGYGNLRSPNISDIFIQSKTLVNDNMTDNIEEIREYIMSKPHKRALKWSNRDKPDWWKV